MSELEKREGPVLECRQLSKIYGAVRALDEVDEYGGASLACWVPTAAERPP